MRCRTCGNELDAGAKLCRTCLTPVAGVPPPSSRRDPSLGSADGAISRRDLVVGTVGGAIVASAGYAIVASTLTYLDTRSRPAGSRPAMRPSSAASLAEPSVPTATLVQREAEQIIPGGTFNLPATQVATPVPPSPTPVPPRPTQVPPTATPVPPTATPVPPSPTSGPKRLIVDASGGGDYKTIASAYANAKSGDTIVVRPGEYEESLTVNRDVRIVGDGMRSKVIVQSEPGANVFNLTGGSPTLAGMWIRTVGSGSIRQTGVTPDEVHAIAITGGTPVIEDCDLNSSADFAVIVDGAKANPIFRNCELKNSFRGGILGRNDAKGTFEKCLIANAIMGPGVFLTTDANPSFLDCVIGRNEGGVYVWGARGTFEKCMVMGNTNGGVSLVYEANPTFRDCSIRDNGGNGVNVSDGGQGTFIGNTLAGNARGAWRIDRSAGKVTRTGNTPNQ